MIGIKVTIKDSENMHEALSEPYVAIQQNIPRTFVAVVDLDTNEIKEISMSMVEKRITNNEYLNWKKS